MKKKLALSFVLLHLALFNQLLAYADSSGATASIDKLGTLMMDILKAIGVPVLIWGVGKFAMGIKNQDAHSMEQSFLFIASGALLIATPILVNAIK